MSLPLLKIDGGEPVALTWTRLKPASEVTTAVPPPPPPIRRPGISLGPERLEMVGEGFDRRELVAADVVADDGLYVIGGKEIKARGMTGETLRYEPNRAWSPADMAAIESEAEAILQAHDFPTHLHWPAGVWAWSDGELYWADAPQHSVLVREGEPDDDMSGVCRAGLGWPEVAARRYPSADAAALWPRFSPFGWAMQVRELQAYRQSAVQTFKRLYLGRLGNVTADVRGGGQPSDDPTTAGGVYARAAKAIHSGEAGPPTWQVQRESEFVNRDLEHVWRIGFEMGAYMTEHRLRSLHGDFVSTGQRSRRTAKLNGHKTGSRRAAQADAKWREAALSLAREKRAEHPSRGKPWLAGEIVKVLEAAPQLARVEAVLLEWEKSGALPKRSSKG
ncbi:MAG: hypothetical protein Q8S03_18050 [Brevundimonas sp.]|uniref:hypothetical protein n=1 Tax=Brevundimonas sp. TaxID=1871086 RepID=UPI002732A171|nr:hypothetical protein [Brevundimonas sp.]MDP3406597.1 hypothetical protein [Brevundimonas sp.]